MRGCALDDDVGPAGDLMNENAFDLWRARIGAVLGPGLFGLLLATGDGTSSSRLGAIFALTGTLWICETIPAAVAALLATAIAIVLGVATSKDAFAAYGNPILFLFIGSFMIAEAMSLHGLGARFARRVTTWARGRLGALMLASSAAFVMSMWISNAAATAVVLPIGLSIARSVDDKKYRAALVLSIAWGASMGGLGTPVGTPPNLIGMRALADAGLGIDFFGWMRIGLPIGVLMLVVMWAVLALIFHVRPGQVQPPHEGEHTPWTRGEFAAATSFALAVALWIFPGILDVMGRPESAWWKAHCPEEVVAVLAAALLFVWPIGSKDAPRAALTWDDAANIDWGTVLLFGGGILLGDLANKSGLAVIWGKQLMELTGASSMWAIVALVTAVALVLSEVASNTAAATLMVPLAFALSKAAGVPPVPAVLGATIGSSFGFMMPISTAPNALAYGTRQVSIRQMATAGIWFDVVGFIAVVLGLRVLCPLLGLV
jgi:sodium-dependent dicarboxylate transporter 2/3/5